VYSFDWCFEIPYAAPAATIVQRAITQTRRRSAARMSWKVVPGSAFSSSAVTTLKWSMRCAPVGTGIRA
jgi:hypothetical protein